MDERGQAGPPVPGEHGNGAGPHGDLTHSANGWAADAGWSGASPGAEQQHADANGRQWHQPVESTVTQGWGDRSAAYYPRPLPLPAGAPAAESRQPVNGAHLGEPAGDDRSRPGGEPGQPYDPDPSGAAHRGQPGPDASPGTGWDHPGHPAAQPGAGWAHGSQRSGPAEWAGGPDGQSAPDWSASAERSEQPDAARHASDDPHRGGPHAQSSGWPEPASTGQAAQTSGPPATGSGPPAPSGAAAVPSPAGSGSSDPRSLPGFGPDADPSRGQHQPAERDRPPVTEMTALMPAVPRQRERAADADRGRSASGGWDGGETTEQLSTPTPPGDPGDAPASGAGAWSSSWAPSWAQGAAGGVAAGSDREGSWPAGGADRGAPWDREPPRGDSGAEPANREREQWTAPHWAEQSGHRPAEPRSGYPRPASGPGFGPSAVPAGGDAGSRSGGPAEPGHPGGGQPAGPADPPGYLPAPGSTGVPPSPDALGHPARSDGQPGYPGQPAGQPVDRSGYQSRREALALPTGPSHRSGAPYRRPEGPHRPTELAAEALPQRVPAEPDVPTVPEPPAVEPPAETPELARIATHLRREDDTPQPRERPDGFDVKAILAAVREVPGVRDASLRTTPAGAHSLRLDLADGADPAEVSRQVARLLQERMGLAAAPQNLPGAADAGQPGTTRSGAQRGQPGEARSASPRARGAEPSGEVPRRRRQATVPRSRSAPEERTGDAPGAAATAGTAPGAGNTATSYSGSPVTSTETAPSRPLNPGAPPGPRVIIDHVQVSTFGLDATVEVRLAAGKQPATGLATGPAVDGYVLRLCAVAAAAAIDQLLSASTRVTERGRCFVEHAAVVPFGSCEVATVVVLLVCDGWVEQLAGSALVAGDPRQAVVRATLAAVNRRLEALLA